MAEPTQADRDQAAALLDEDGYEPTVWAIAQALADRRAVLARLVRAVDALPDGAFYRGKAHERVTDLPEALAAARKALG